MRRSHRSALPLVAILLLVATLPGSATAAEGVGTFSGKVLDEQGNPLPGAALVVEETSIAVATNLAGEFRISRVPAGNRTVTVSYLGLEPASVGFELSSGEVVQRTVILERRSYAEAITVSSEPILHGQAKALNQQKNALNITNIVSSDQFGRFPDRNAAEATQRIPAITLQRDQGEGRFVIVRGTEARLNSMMVNGERLPSPESGGREIPLDVLPADLLEAIEVTKALTPDMDGDAIGGAVNLVTKLAPESSRLAATLAGGHNALSDDGIRNGNLTYGNRLGNGRVGFLLSGSAFETDRETHNIEPKYDDGNLEELEFRSYTITRERYGLTGSLDFQASDRSRLYVRSMWNEYSDQEFRRKKEQQVTKDRIDRELKDRYEGQTINTASFGGDQVVRPSLLVDYRVGYSFADEDEPNRRDTNFRQKKVAFDPNVSPDHIDPDDIRANPQNEALDKFKLDEIAVENNYVEEDDLFALVNVRRPFYSSDRFSGMASFGAKARFKDKQNDNNAEIFELDDILLIDHLEAGWSTADPFFKDRYEIGLFSGAGVPNSLLPLADGERDVEEDLADYAIDEDTLAAYGMVELNLGAHVSFLGGVRYEETESDYSAFEAVFDEEGDLATLAPILGRNSYDELLPQVHFRYRLGDRSNLRAAVTRSLARPNFGDLVPFRLTLREDEEIVLGNPALDPTTAWNLDLLFEHYFSSVGIVSAGVFYKDITDTIFVLSTDQEIDGSDFEVTQPINAGDGKVMGFETALQRKFRTLPAPFDGLGIYLNYTYADSEGDILGRDLDRLPGQAEHVGNFALSYEKGGFSGRLSINHQSEYQFQEVGETPTEDLFIDAHTQLDFAAQHKIHGKLSLFLEVINLTNEPHRVYEGHPDRTIQEDYYKAWGMIGVKLDL